MAVDVWASYRYEATLLGDNPEARFVAHASGSEDEEEVFNAFAAFIPATYRGLWLQALNPRHLGGGVWDADARYGRRSPQAAATELTGEPGSATAAGTAGEGWRVRASYGGGTQKSVRSLATVASYPGGGGALAWSEVAGGQVVSIVITDGGSGYTTAPAVVISGGGGAGATATASVAGGRVNLITLTAGGTGYTTEPDVTFAFPFAPDMGGLIGVGSDGTVEGVDLQIPVTTVVCTKKFKAAVLPPTYSDACDRLRRHVNIAPIILVNNGQVRTYLPGEARLEGAEIVDVADDEVEVSLTLAIERNTTQQVQLYPDGDTVVTATVRKQGWDYVWFKPATAVRQDAAGRSMTVKVPQYAYVERVYFRANLLEVLL